MSLINQVLKDLEQRHASEMAEATHNLDGLALASPMMQPPRARKTWFIASLFSLLAVAGAVALWWWQQQPSLSQTSVANTATTSLSTQAADSAAAPVVTAKTNTVSVATGKPVAAKPVTAQAEKIQHQSSPDVVKVVSKTPLASPADDEAPINNIEKQMVPLRSDQKAELAYQAAYDQLQQHNARRAEQQLRQVLALEPRHTRARELLAGILIKQGRWIETAELLQQGVQVLPQHAVFIKLYARALMQLNRDQQAITLLREHAPPIAQDPEHYALLAALYQRQQDHSAAVSTYGEILKQRPDAGIWWVGLGISLEAMGKQKQAQQAYSQARQTGGLHGDIARYTDNRLAALDAIRYPVD